MSSKKIKINSGRELRGIKNSFQPILRPIETYLPTQNILGIDFLIPGIQICSCQILHKSVQQFNRYSITEIQIFPLIISTQGIIHASILINISMDYSLCWSFI